MSTPLQFQLQQPSSMSATGIIATDPSAFGLNIPFDAIRGNGSVTGIGFRVIANGYNHNSITARNPNEPATFASVDNHLSWRQKPTPWVSIYWTWFAALRRAKWYTDKGSSNVSIIVIDLEKPNTTMLSASALQAHIGCSNPKFHTYELLIHQRIDDNLNGGAVIAYIPVAGDHVDVEGHLCRMRVPQSVVDKAGGKTDDDIRRWVKMEIHSRTGVWDDPMTLRVMQSLAVDSWDDVSDLPYGVDEG